MITILNFHMSEAQAENFPDWESRHLELRLVGNVQISYDCLRTVNGDTIASFVDGFWKASADDRVYSDIGIALGE